MNNPLPNIANDAAARGVTQRVAALVVAGCVCCPLGVQAVQTSERKDVQRDTVTLSELNVTALKQEDRLRSEAIAATVVGQVELERLDAVSIKGISDVVPNFYIPDYGSRITSSIYVRGIGARMDQPAVGLTIDNVPVLNKDAYDFDLSDIVSVEMLRGPQSTLYGRNTMGGLISVTTLSPLRWQGWRVSAQGGNGPTFRLSAGWYHRFSRKAGISVTANGSYCGGFFKNLYNGEKTDKERSVGARTKFEWRPAYDINLQNVLSTSVLRQGGYPYESVKTGEVNYNDTCFYRRFTLTDGLTLRKMHEHFSATSITSAQYIDDNMTLDQDFLADPYFTLTQKKREIGITEDILFRTPQHHDGIYRWLAGLFGFWKHNSMHAPVTFKDTGIASLIESHRNGANPYYPIAWDGREFTLNSDFTLKTFGLAAYHESKVSLGRWRLTGGVRLEYERTAMDYHSYCDTGYTIYDNPSGAIPTDGLGNCSVYREVDVDIDDRGRLARHYLMVLPKFGAVFTLGEEADDNLYLNVSRGYKTGGFNTQMFSDVLQQRLMNIMGMGSRYDVDDVVGYKPESSWNYEIGAHLGWGSIGLTADAALFYIDCRDQQLTMFPEGTTTGRLMTNAGRTRSYGAEVSLAWQSGSGFSANASYGYTNARFVEFFDGRENFKGKHLPYAPSNTLFLQALYTLNIYKGDVDKGNVVKGEVENARKGESRRKGRKYRGVKTIEFDLNLRGTGKIWWNEANTLSQPLYAVLGAGITVSGEDWSVQLWGKNLTATRYDTFYFMSMGNEFLQRGRPLTAGVTINLRINGK